MPGIPAVPIYPGHFGDTRRHAVARAAVETDPWSGIQRYPDSPPMQLTPDEEYELELARKNFMSQGDPVSRENSQRFYEQRKKELYRQAESRSAGAVSAGGVAPADS